MRATPLIPIETAPDARRGFDHGVSVPLGLMYPNADMPIVMVSIKSNYDPAEHLALGEALAPLREEGVLIVGSGLNYHNMRGFGQDSSTQDAELFTRYLNEAITLKDTRARDERLLHWESAHAPDWHIPARITSCLFWRPQVPREVTQDEFFSLKA